MSEATMTSTELVIPVTGELVPLDAESDILAEAAWRMRELETELARVRRQVGEELVRRMDMENLRSVEVAGYVISVDAPGGVDWDAKQLDETLGQLVEGGVITEGARRRVVPLKPSVSQRELKKLLATLDSPDLELVEACSEASRKTRRVKVDNAAMKARA
jgi:hypothetical protein